MSAQTIFPLAQWLEGTNQNSVPANDNTLRVQAVNQPAIAFAATAPSTPAAFAQYVVSTAWGGHAVGNVVIYDGAAWHEFAAYEGMTKIIAGAKKIYTSGAWATDSSGGGIVSVVAGTGVTVDDTDPANPVVSAPGSAGVVSVVAGSGVSVDNTDPANPIVSATGGGGGGGGGITIDAFSAPALPMPQNILRDTGNPVLGLGSSGQFDAGSVRDNDLFYARGKLWMLYTGADTPTTPYNPTVGLASSTDEGATWTKLGRIIPKNATSGQWNSGSIFSPCSYYDSATDELYVYVSGTETGAEWYTGPIAIGVLKASAGADWSDPTSFVYQNSGAPIITVTQAWEGSQGVYSPTVKKLGNQFVMLYSSSGDPGTGYEWHIGRATATSAAGPFTKDTGNPVIAAAEEASMLQLYGGTLIALCDNLDASTGLGAYGMAVWGCSTPDGMGTWTKLGLILSDSSQTFDSRAIGSGAGVLMPDGRIVIMYNGAATGAPDDRRTIGCARGLAQLNVALDKTGINTLIAEALAATGGSGDLHQAYVQLHVEALPGTRIFDVGPRRRYVLFGGTISNSTSNPLFGTVSIRSTAGSGYVYTPNSVEFNIASGEDFTLETWICFQNAASSLEMIFECNIGGLAVYRGSDGKIEIAQSSVAAIHKDTSHVIGAGAWTFLVIQRTAGQLAFFHAAPGDATMTAGDTYSGDTTSYTSTHQLTLMAGNDGAASFMHGDMAELRYSPGVSRGYTNLTPVPTAYLPQ